MNAMQNKINEILSDFIWENTTEENTKNALLKEGVPNTIVNFMLESPLHFMNLKEDIEEQPNLFNDEESTFYDDNGLELVNVIKNKQGTKDYIFNTESGDYINGLLRDPSDVSYAAKIIADAYQNSDEMAKIFDKANREDNVIFNTSNAGKIKISMNDIFDYINFNKREERFNSIN